MGIKFVINTLLNPKDKDFNTNIKIVSNIVKSKTWSLVRAILLIGLSFVLIYPLLYTLSISVRLSKDLFDPLSMWIPRRFTMENFIDAWNTMKYPVAFINTVKVGAISSIIQVASCAMVGYGFARFKFRGSGIWFAFVLFTIFVPPQLIIVPSYLQYRFFDLFGIGALLGLVRGTPVTVNLLDKVLVFYIPAFFGVGIRSGLFIFVFRQFFRGMPKELQESAYIDGCSQFKTFIRIMLPNALPAVVTVTLFSLVWYWNDYYHAAMFFSNIKTVSLALSGLREEFILSLQGFDYSMINDPYILVTRVQAGVFLTLFPILMLYLVLQKYFVESIERTGIVG